jgi:hypothetical protein
MSEHEGEQQGGQRLAPNGPGGTVTQYPPPQYPPPQQPAAHPPPQYAEPAQGPRPDDSLVARAKANDRQALETMFSQFLPEGEQIVDCQYLGVLGLWGIGTHSFAAVTSRRVATLRISLLGGIQYQEGALEYVNSAAAHQPSIVSLYFGVARYALGTLVVAIILGVGVHWAASLLIILLGVICVPVYVRFYYRKHKSGVVLWIREGVQVYAFIDRARMLIANRLYRECMNLREERLRALGHP